MAKKKGLTAKQILNLLFTRDELRVIARKMGLKTGRNKSDTINNIMKAEKKYIVQLSMDVKIKGGKIK